MEMGINKIEKLTVNNVNTLIIHSTRSSLNRSIKDKHVERILETDQVPTLYYVLEFNKDNNNYTYSIHALTSDLNRFLSIHPLDN